jgi:hypothetical protein
MLVIAWHMLSTGSTYEDLGGDYFASRRSPDVEARRLVKRLEALGLTVTVTQAA